MRLRILVFSLAAATGLGLAGLFFCARTPPKAERVAPAKEPSARAQRAAKRSRGASVGVGPHELIEEPSARAQRAAKRSRGASVDSLEPTGRRGWGPVARRDVGPHELIEEPAPDLASLVESLSEPSGYFDTDNLISNETSYLQVSETLGERAVQGGVYLGVGPDQNFTYIARTRPRRAFILDIRRQNMLELLLFNALFAQAETPYEYLSLLLSRAGSAAQPEEAGIGPLLAALDATRPGEVVFERNLKVALEHVQGRLRFPLTEEDQSALRAVYRQFFEEQLELKFKSHGRPSMPYHPTLRELLLARDPSGREGHFLASLDDYAYVRELHRAGRVVPVVGDFAGPHSLRDIGDFLRARGETVSVFYVSNVEFYLVRSGHFDRYVANLAGLPVEERSLFIRSYFDYGLPHPAGLPGERSTTILQRIPRFLSLYESGAYRSYWDVCTRDYLQ